MPDVRRACAAPVLGTGSTSPSPHIRAAGRSSPRALNLASRDPSRHPLTPGAHPVVALRSPHLVTHRRGLTTGTADAASLTIHGSSRAFALRPFGSSALAVRNRRSARPRDRREPRNAQFHSAVGLGFPPGSSPHPQRRPGPVPRSSAAAVFLNPPRTHSVAPNPGMQRTRCARR
jgi:hypothetical protein